MFYLKVAGLAEVGTSMAVFIVITAFGYFGWLETLLGYSLYLQTFSAASAAVVANRLKKMLIDPIAVGFQANFAKPLAFCLVAPVSMAISAVFAHYGLEVIITIIYPASYVCVAGITAALVFLVMRKPQ